MNKEVKAKADKPKVEHKEEMIKPAGKDLPRRSVSASAPMKKKNAFYLGGVNPLKLAFAMRHLGIMLKSGLSLEAAVSVLAEQLDDNRLKDIFAEILYDINKRRSDCSEWICSKWCEGRYKEVREA